MPLPVPPAVRRARQVVTERGVRGLTGPARRRAAEAAAGARVRGELAVRRGTVPGLLSVVVPAYNVEAYLDECLDSIRHQAYRRIEVIVVDDGSPDRVAEIAQAHAKRDPRVRLVQRANGGLSAARNTGVEHARGEFLTFIDSDDTVADTAFSAPIAALEESGSDFAVTHYDRLEGGALTPAGGWIREAHAVRRLGQTLETFPTAMVNAVAWSKVYRRDFWDRAGLSFPEGRLYEDQPVSSAAYAKARAFDVVPDIGVHWRIRTDQSSISQKQYSASNLAAHNVAVETSLAALRAEGHEEAATERALQLLANNMKFFARQLLRSDEEFRALLRECLVSLLAQVPEERVVRAVDAEDKVLYWLVIEDRIADALDFLDAFGPEIRRFASERSTDPAWPGFRALLPHADSLAPQWSLLSDKQLELYARVLRTFVEPGPDTDSGTGDVLTIAGWAYVRSLDLAANPPTIRVWLESGERRLPLAVTLHSEGRIDRISGYWFCDYRPGGFTATIPVADLPTQPGRWQLRVEVEAGGVRRSGPVTENSQAGSSVIAHSSVAEGVLRTIAYADRGELDRGPTLVVRRAEVQAVDAVVDDGRLLVRLAERGPEVLGLSIGDLEAVAALDGRWAFALADLPASGALRARLRPRLRDRGRRRVVPVVAAPGTPTSPLLPGDERVLSMSPTGALELADRHVLATGYDHDDTAYGLDLVAPPGLRAGLASGRVVALLHDANNNEFAGTVTAPDADGRFRVAFPMTETRWGRPGLALPMGKYAVSLVDGARRIPVLPSAPLLRVLPDEALTAKHRALWEVHPSRTADAQPTLALNLRVPLAEDEGGPRNQYRLRLEHRADRAERPAVLFRSLYGEVANCNGLGVHEELVRRGTDLELLWSVRDYGVPVPEGGVPLVEGTRAWHDAIAQSRYYMINLHQVEWFHKPPGQIMIETFHGYPYKVMGHQWWEKTGFTDSHIMLLDRRARDWDYFVSPATYATPLLQEAFLAPAGATAEILEIGYPRNDVLLRPEGEAIRRRTREVLGIRDDQTAVLYAPTFRDYLSPDDMVAARIDFLDAERASAALGDDVVLLVRGHAFNRRTEGRQANSATVVDVTDHPDVNDLILASDAAILDYSSLRFDYGLTDKPMIFFVPDLERYMAARGGVIPYEPTAPGPFMRTTDEVVARIRDLGAVRRDYAAARETFRREYADLDDGEAAARLVDAVFVPRGDAPPR